jgi:hypothetical protein
MTVAVATVPNRVVTKKAANEPPLWFVVVIFWAAFAVAVVSTGIIDPHLFEGQDPDAFLRLVQVRDLLGGQGWFDLVQHRMDPPAGALLHWSRLIDAPIAGLILLGNLFGDGERFALMAWPVLLLLGMMGSAAAIASAIAGRAAAVWSLVLALFFLDPLVVYLPGDIDHHNAQIALTMATVAFALRIGSSALFGFLAATTSALTLAIGLEMLPHIAIIGAVIALQWAVTGKNRRATAAYGLTIALLPADLYAVSGSPAAAWACDSLSFAYTIPAAIAGLGLAGLAAFGGRLGGRAPRLAGLIVVGGIAAAVFAIVSPSCLSGPYGFLSPELKKAWLQTVTEAQPIQQYFQREPVGAFASVVPLLVALAVAAFHLRPSAGERRKLWIVPTILLVMAASLSFYQIRTLPFASAIAIPILGAWVAEVRARGIARSTNPVKRAFPVALAFLAAAQITYILAGVPGLDLLTYLSDGRIAARKTPQPPEELVKGLTQAQKDCFDPTSAELFAVVPKGLVLAPLFYGPSVLKLSGHNVVGGPYHRNGKAILDTIHATHGEPAEAKAIIDERHVDYVALCSVSFEAAIAAHKAPDGLIADLISGKVPPWLQPVAAPEKTQLRLWRVVR